MLILVALLIHYASDTHDIYILKYCVLDSHIELRELHVS